MEIKDAKKEIREAHNVRAVMYHYILEEMEKAFGEEKAREVFSRATFRKGRDARKQYKDERLRERVIRWARQQGLELRERKGEQQ